jgi:hypothetical protein
VADSRSTGVLDDLFIECHERTADAAHFGHDHFRIYLCGAVCVVNFWRSGLRRALAHLLKADHPSDRRRYCWTTDFPTKQTDMLGGMLGIEGLFGQNTRSVLSGHRLASA